MNKYGNQTPIGGGRLAPIGALRKLTVEKPKPKAKAGSFLRTTLLPRRSSNLTSSCMKTTGPLLKPLKTKFKRSLVIL